MRRKEVNRARREWINLAEQEGDAPLVEWAEKWGWKLLEKVRRLRQDVKRANAKRRDKLGPLYKKLEIEQTDLDALIDAIEVLRDKIPNDPLSDVSGSWLVTRLDRILDPFMEDHEGKKEEFDIL